MSAVPHKVPLDQSEWLEFSPVVWRPSSSDERMAALVGYMTGDGAIAKRAQTYTRKDGGVSVYEGALQSAFYSNEAGDLDEILEDCKALGIAVGASVRIKKTKEGYAHGYQIQLGSGDTFKLVDSGAPVGAKTAQEFDVPAWIRSGPNEVKRAYLAALFGAEGTAPASDKSSKARTPRGPTLNMCKRAGHSADAFFASLVRMVNELGVDCATTTTVGPDGYSTYWLRIGSTAENLIKFFDEIGFVYCQTKAVLAWQWSKYLKAYKHEAESRASVALSKTDAESYDDLGRKLGLTRGAAFRLRKDLLDGKSSTAGHAFPHFQQWMADRWIDDLGLLRVKVVKKKTRSQPEKVWNLRVSSHDHSYLLANGANNFNSFETASGRIYEDYGKDNRTDAEIEPHEQLLWYHDFNYTPMSSGIGVRRGNDLYLLDEIILTSAVARQSALEFVEKYKDHKNRHVLIYGDPAGRAGEKHGHQSDYTEMEAVLRENGWQLTRKVKKAAPAIKDRQNAVRAKIKNAAGEVSLFVNPSKAPTTHKGLATVQLKEGSTFIEEDSHVQHITTAIGYMVDYEFPIVKNTISIGRTTGL